MDNSFAVLLVTYIVLFIANLGQAYLLKKNEKELEACYIHINELVGECNDYFLRANRYRELSDYKNKIPEGCKQGPWCGACQFGQLMMVYSSPGEEEPYYYCIKGECCDYWKERSETDG